MNPLAKKILWRLLTGVGVLWGAATLTFIALHVTHDDPVLAILGGGETVPSPAVVEQVRSEFRLDQPLHAQYLYYVGRLARFDLGESYRLRMPVARAIAQQLLPTVQLATVAGAAAFLLAVTIAVATANRAPPIRRLVSGLEVGLSSVPGFVLGIALLLVFAFQLHWLPASGQRDWRSIILPSLTLALPMAAQITQILRAQMEEVLEQPFILAARARGVSEMNLRLTHALRHALIPVVTLLGYMVGFLLGGAVIIETLFARQGIGRLMADAAQTKDIPLVLGITLLAAVTYVVVNLIVDLINAAIDPRQKHA